MKVVLLSFLSIFSAGCYSTTWIRTSDVTKLSSGPRLLTERTCVEEKTATAKKSTCRITRAHRGSTIQTEKGTTLKTPKAIHSLRLHLRNGKKYNIKPPLLASLDHNRLTISGKNLVQSTVRLSEVDRVGFQIYNKKIPLIFGITLGTLAVVAASIVGFGYVISSGTSSSIAF